MFKSIKVKVDSFYKYNNGVKVFNLVPYINFGKTIDCKFLNIGWLFFNIQVKS